MAFAVDLTGSILDRRYRITGLLGKGGMGHVYDAVHVALDQRVAVKVLHPRYAYEERFRERFLQEARAASRIRHPNVVEIKDFGDTPDGSVYFVMEYLGGHDVGEELKQHGALPWPRTRNILLQATSALLAAHAAHIIHRDIKPGNCFLTRSNDGLHDDCVKLLDFGIAKVGSDSHADAQDKGLTGTGEVFGTASYMAPEQARGESLDARSDLYSLGIMAYEMLTGQVPFTGVNSIHVITRHLNDRPEPLRSLDPKIPQVVESLVLRMIAKAPHDRYASMEALERALQAIPSTAGRTTRVWSSPGELRALVQEKKSGATGVVLAPGRLGGATGTDPERTQLVVPTTPESGGSRGVKKTFVPGEGSSSLGTAGSVAQPDVAPVAPVVAVAAASVVAPSSPSPPYGDGTNPPPGRASDRTNPPPVRYDSGTTNPPPAHYGSGTASPPPAPYGGTTNPPPGIAERSGASLAWHPSTTSTGPMGRVSDTGTETKPHSLEKSAAQGISGRLVVVVGLLVVLVGGGSALMTMAFLSEQAGASGRTGAQAADGAGARDEAAGSEDAAAPVQAPVPLRVEEETLEAIDAVAPLADLGASEAGPSAGEADVIAIVEDDDEDDLDGGTEDDETLIADPDDRSQEDDDGANEPPPATEPVQPAQPRVPAHETEKCAKVRAAADAALDHRKWKNAARYAHQKRCWSASEQADRRRLEVIALLEADLFEECIAAGRKATDAQTMKLVSKCRERAKQ